MFQFCIFRVFVDINILNFNQLTVFDWSFLFHDLVRKQQTNYRSIHDAVRSGDVSQVEYMVKNGAGINEVESDTKFTPMHCACYMGALEVRIYRLE